MATIITRETGATAKGSPLTNAEVDNNFIHLNEEKLELGQTQPSGTAKALLFLNNSKQVADAGSAVQFDGTTLSVASTGTTETSVTNKQYVDTQNVAFGVVFGW